MTYQITLTIESDRPRVDILKDVQAAVASWGIDASEATIEPAETQASE